MPKLIVGNWKMNNAVKDSVILARQLRNSLKNTKIQNNTIICPPYTSLYAVSNELSSSKILLGAQNMHYADNGAYTGEISPIMLKETGCKYVIIGHSERRQYFFENDELINKKIAAALKHGLVPILCVGERLEEREKNIQTNIVESQLNNALKNIIIKNPNELVIAYEPVWAIGTGKNATPEQAEEMHSFIRGILSKKYNIGSKIRILYGGSVNEKNAKELLCRKNIDGALVGGASLKADSFLGIINAA